MSRRIGVSRVATLALTLLAAGCGGQAGDGGNASAAASDSGANVTFATVPPINPGADLDGVWVAEAPTAALKTADGREPPLNAAGQQALAATAADKARGWDGTARCLPPGVPRLFTITKPFRIVTGKHLVTMSFQDQRLARLILLDDTYGGIPDPSYLGSATGRWEGATLVVDSERFKEGTRLDGRGLPHGPAMKLQERYALDGPDRLVDTITVTDPAFYTRPWTARLTFTRDAREPTEEICAEERKLFAR